MQYRVLGPLEVHDGDRVVPVGGYRQRLLLAILVSRPGEHLRTDWLVDAVWGEHPPRTARKTLQAYVARLRALLGTALIDSTQDGYRWAGDRSDIDSHRFEQLASRGRAQLPTDAAGASGTLRDALGLWRGLPFGDLAGEPALVAEVQRLTDLRSTATCDRLQAELDRGAGPDLVGQLTERLDEHPADERLRGQLMLALYRAGRQADALEAFHTGRTLLADELGVDPSEHLTDLYERMLRHDPELLPVTRPDAFGEQEPPRNPYKGLRPFTSRDSVDFFGQDGLVQRILDAVEHRSLVAVVGPSGSGKSSAVAAGVLPRLEAQGRWTVCVMVPGRSPFHALAAALRVHRDDPDITSAFVGDDLDLLRAAPLVVGESSPRLLLVVDQFEELLSESAAHARPRFLRNLTEAAADPGCPITVLVTLRGDFFDRMVEQMPDGTLLADAVVPALPLSSADLASAASRPAEGVGVAIEPELIAEIVADMTDQPGGLPLFEYALTELFDANTGPVLTRATYHALGGLQGALARRAEATFCALEPAEQEAAHQVFLRLVDVSDVTETRRRVDRTELEAIGAHSGAIGTALGAFDRARLLTFDRNPESGVPTVEVAHEALLVAWPRLRGWLDEAHDDLRLHRSLSEEVDEWERSGRAEDYLIGGSRLAQFDAWPTKGAVTPTEPELAFLRASRIRREAAAMARRRSRRRLQGLVAVAALAAVLAGGLAWVAVDRGQEAEASERTAHARELANAALSVVDDDPELATLLAIESIEVTRPDGGPLREAETALHAAVTADRLVSVFAGRWRAAFTPEGDVLVGGVPAHVVDPLTGEDVVTLPTLPDGLEVDSVAVSVDGTLATGTDGSPSRLILYDSDGTEVREMRSARYGRAHGDTIGPLEFSPDGALLASLAPWGGGLTVWETTSGDLLSTHAEGVFSGPPVTVDIAFSPDSTLLALARDDVVRLLDLQTERWSAVDAPHNGFTSAVVFLADGTSLATAGWDGTIQVHDLESGRLLSTTDAEAGQLIVMRASADRRRLVTGSDTGTVRVWEVNGSAVTPVADLPGLNDAVTSVAFDATGERVAAVGFDGTTAVWDASAAGRGEIARWPGGSAVFGRDGSLVASVDPSQTSVDIVDTADWRRVSRIDDVATADGMVTGIDLSPDGSTLVTTTIEDAEHWGSLATWDVATGESRGTIVEHPELPGAVTYSDDGRYIAAGTFSATMQGGVWDTAEQRFALIMTGQRAGQAVALSSDGSLVAVDTEAESAPNVQIWDVGSADVVTAVQHTAMWRGGLDFSPDDTRLVSGGADGTARVWDVATGERLLTLTGHTGPVEDVLYTPDGRQIVTSSSDGTVRAWSADTGEMQLVLSGHDSFALLSMSPDGRYLLTSDDTTARVWALDVDELTDIAHARLTRGMTAAECETYHVENCG